MTRVILVIESTLCPRGNTTITFQQFVGAVTLARVFEPFTRGSSVQVGGSGVGLTIGMRAMFGLMQVGRLLQYTAFWLSAALSLKIIGIIGGLLFAASLTVNSALLAGFTVFAMAFAAATITGEVPTKGRTWLPMKMKSPPKK